MEVEGVVANPPGHCALLVAAGLRGLALDAQVHDVVAADGTRIHHKVPGPQSHCIPLLHLVFVRLLHFDMLSRVLRIVTDLENRATSFGISIGHVCFIIFCLGHVHILCDFLLCFICAHGLRKKSFLGFNRFGKRDEKKKEIPLKEGVKLIREISSALL